MIYYRLYIFRLFIPVLVLLFYSCSNTRFLTGDQILYEGRKDVVIINKEQIDGLKTVSEIGNSMTSYKPNNSLFGKKRSLPPVGLWSYNYLKPKGKGKLSNWLYRTLSGEPVFISQVNPDLRCRNIETRLFNSGFFNSKAWSVVDTNKRNPRKAKISYYIRANNPFRINNIFYTTPVDAVDSAIISGKDKLTLKTGDLFNLETVKTGTQKKASTLVEQGYYFFKPTCIQIIADTVEKPFRIDLLIGKRVDIPDFVYHKYSINQIKVNMTGLSVNSSGASILQDSVFHDGIYLTGLQNYLKPEVITRSIKFRTGDLYSSSKNQLTIQRLNNNGVFRYVKTQFIVRDTLSRKMDLLIDLAPLKDVSLDLEGNIETKSSGFTGPGIAVTLAHANMNRAANKLQLKLQGNIEWQFGKVDSSFLGNTSYSIGINSSFAFPRFVLPFSIPSESRLLMSKTIINLGYEFTNKVQYYRMSAINLGWGYQWKKSQKVSHSFYPFNLNLVNLLETTPEFDDIIATNPYVKKSFEEEFIAGMKYDLIYDNTSRKPNGFYGQFSLSSAGNLIELLKINSSGERPYTIFGNIYSQFIKASADLRLYTNTVKRGLVLRLYAGTGYSYGNSTVMPYVEQFYSGGASSLRAFTARSVGPGSYKPEVINGLIDQTGDIKLEGNIEYRFPFSKTVQGGIFIDAGNVWLLNEDESRPGANFKFGTFIDQLAVGTGFGLRFDFNFFVMRTDIGLPLRTPYVTETGNWLTTTKEVFSGSMFNLAIGYPF
jgi:outer membrane protein assembly factor BamA